MFKTILVALDGSENARRAIPYAVDLARAEDARIVVAHIDQRIVAKGDMPTVHPDEDEIRADVTRVTDDLAGQGIDSSLRTATIVVGGPAHAIAEIADEEGADLIITGTRGHTSLAGLLLGSVTHRLLHIAKQPVLVIPDTTD